MAGLSLVIEDILKLCEVKEKERIVLLTGHLYDVPLLDEYMVALSNLKTDFLRVIEPVATGSKNVGEQPLIGELLKGADMVIEVRSDDSFNEKIPRVSSLHSPAFKEVLDANPKLRWLSVGLPFPEINYRRLFPSEAMLKRTYAGVKVMERAKEIRITSKEGTEFRCRKDGQPVNYQTGLVNSEHEWDNYGCGNVSTIPIRDSAEGVIVVSSGDHWHYPNVPHKLYCFQEPVKLTFKEGRIVDIEGGMEAKLIRRHMESYGSDSVYYISHVGWGTADGGVWLDNRLFSVADWEGTYGTMMIHFGGYRGIGGPHVSGPTVVDHDIFLDGEPVVLNNEIVHPECK